MKNTFRKLLSVLLACVLLAGVLPNFAAFARTALYGVEVRGLVKK